jgi:hypothetical protein
MTPEETFALWAPPEAVWSRWVKPVLFAHLAAPPAEAPICVSPSILWPERPEPDTAIVVDLPGPSSVAAGLALAERGYRPVPLFNAVPGPPGASCVDVWPIVAEIVRGSERLASARLSPAAPPAFLLDRSRQLGRIEGESLFDNRSASFPTDFPSARFLAQAGIRRAVLLQEFATGPQFDLAHTLREWQRGGISLAEASLDVRTPRPLSVGRPGLIGWVWFRALTLFKLKPNPLGGYGGWVHPSAG